MADVKVDLEIEIDTRKSHSSRSEDSSVSPTLERYLTSNSSRSENLLSGLET